MTLWLVLVLGAGDPPTKAQESAQSSGADERVAEEASTDEQATTIEGQATVGLRLNQIDGSSAQYDEDVNLPEGLFLHGFELRARGLGPVESLLLRADGVGDAFSTYRLEANRGPLRTIGRFDKTRFSANSQADQHPFDITREIGALDFEYAPSKQGKRYGIGVDYLHRDGLWIGSRSAGLETVSGFPVRREERGTGLHGNYASVAAGWRLALELGLRKLESDDSLSFDQPSPGFPGGTLAEDFHAAADSTTSRGTLGLARDLGDDGTKLELHFGWQVDDVVGNSQSEEVGFALFDPSSPFVSNTSSHLDLDHDRITGEAGLVWPLGEDTELELRYAREYDQRDGSEPRTVVQDELTGDPPSVSTFKDVSTSSGALDLFSLGAHTRPSEHSDLDIQLEWGNEDLQVQEVVNGVTVRSFDGTVDQFGGEGKLTFGIGRGWSLDLGAGHGQRPTASAEIGSAFDILDEHASFGRLGCRWRGERCCLEGSARVEHRESDAFTSEGDYGTYAAAFAGQVGGHTTLDLGLALQTYSLESETTLLFARPGGGVIVLPGVAGFGGHQVMWNGSLELDLAPLKPNFGWSAALSTGSSEFSYETAHLALPWKFSYAVEVGVETAYFDFDGDAALDDSDYDALLLEFFVRYAFGAHAASESALP